MGECDGVTQWKPFPSFSSNHLSKHEAMFVCSRNDREYESTLVFPLFYRQHTPTTSHSAGAFLAFDSPLEEAFPGIPETLEYRDGQITRYLHDALSSSAYNMAKVMAEALKILFRPDFHTGDAQQGGETYEPLPE
jgi:hypothetical protein